MKNRWKKIGRNLKKFEKWGEKAFFKGQKKVLKRVENMKKGRDVGEKEAIVRFVHEHRADLVLVSIAFEDGFNILAKFPSSRLTSNIQFLFGQKSIQLIEKVVNAHVQIRPNQV